MTPGGLEVMDVAGSAFWGGTFLVGKRVPLPCPLPLPGFCGCFPCLPRPVLGGYRLCGFLFLVIV